MKWKTTLLAAFWITSVVMILGLPSCKPCDGDCDMSKLTTQDTVVPPPIAQCRINAYNDFASSFKQISDSLGYNIVNYNASAFAIPIVNLSKIDSGGMKGIEGSEKAWTMLALDPATKGAPQTVKVYLAAQDIIKRTAIFYDITDRQAPRRIQPDSAKTNIDAFQEYVTELTAATQYQGRKIFYPKGFQYPWRDIVDIYESKKEGNYIYGLLVMKPASTAATDNVEVDMYIYADIIPQSKASQLFNGNGSGGGTFFDVTLPCPTACPF